MHPRRNRVRLAEAWRGVRALIADPDDTTQVFKIIRALSGNSIERQFRRFRSTPIGSTVLTEHRVLVELLSDREYLHALPEGSLGRTYASFTESEQITPGGLVDASMPAPEDETPLDPERRLFADRLRDSHDLWHVLTGYGRDLIGEAALLAFTYRQTRNRGIGFIVAVAYWRVGRDLPGQRSMIRDGFRRGGRAAWLPGADWEALLERPLEEVRRVLEIEPVGDYPRLRSEGAPAVA